MGSAESRGGVHAEDRLCGQCNDAGSYQQSFCVKRGQLRRETESVGLSNSVHLPAGDELNGRATESDYTEPAEESASVYYSQQEAPDSWRFHGGADDSVGVGAYFGRLEGQKDSVARVKSLVSGGPAEQTGMIEVGDALCAVDDIDVYGRPLCDLGKYVLGPSGSVVKLTFEKRQTVRTHIRI